MIRGRVVPSRQRKMPRIVEPRQSMAASSSMTAPTEFEIKLELPSDRPVRLADFPALRQTSRTVRSEKLVSVYFDTDRLKFGRHKVTLRVRRIGRQHIQTIKTGDGLFERGEWETAIASDHPDLKA